MSSCGKNENPQEMNRRKFLKVFGGGALRRRFTVALPRMSRGRLWR
jgi:hypothetical protein